MSQQLSKRRNAAIALAAIIALLFWSELIFSNLPSLADVDTPANTLGWTTAATRLYFTLLAILDVIGGVGAVLFIVLVLRKGRERWVNNMLWATAVATSIYGIVQFIVAFRLPPDLRLFYWAIGLVYILMAIGLRRLYRQ